MADESSRSVSFVGEKTVKIIKWHIKLKSKISKGTLLFIYQNLESDPDTVNSTATKYRSNAVGVVEKILKNEGDAVKVGDRLLILQECSHPIVMKEMCAECGADLKQVSSGNSNFSASVAMVHSIPELIVSQEQAHVLGKADEEQLLKYRKLVLLVDLDQTLIHTTNDNIPPNIKDVFHFQLYGARTPWYHTRLRPGTREFLENISKLYELHICTFGSRPYAHMIAHLLDKDGKFFSHRILSRDECFNPTSKTANLKALFPCGDSMVCIIDDREDVWNYSPNLIHVKPYHFFQHTGDINAPPGLTKTEHDSEKPKFVVASISSSTNENFSTDDVECETSAASVENCTVANDGLDKSTNNGGRSLETNSSDISEETDKSILKQDQSSAESVNAEESTEKNNIEESSEDSSKKDSALPNVNESDSGSGLSKNTSKESDEIINKDILVKANDDFDDDKLTEESGSVLTVDDTNSCNDEVIIQDDDDHLLHLEDKLVRIHKAYYDLYDNLKLKGNGEIPDIKIIVPAECKKVLKGTNIVFSGVFPFSMPPEKSKAWVLAKSLGAVIQQRIVSNRHKGRTPPTTHLIAARLGTAKVNEAKKLKHVKIVNPQWLWCCAERWEKVDESLFPLTRQTSIDFSQPLHKHNLIHGPTYENYLSNSPNEGLQRPVEVYPLYDPVTGKRINPPPAIQNSGKSENDSSKKTFVNSINPLLSFSTDDIAEMDQEVEDVFNESDSETENSKANAQKKQKKYSSSDDSDSSDESLSGDHPHGWGAPYKKMKLQQDTDEMESDTEMEFVRFPRSILPNDSEKSEIDSSSSDFKESVGSVDEEMAAAVEREFLGL